MDFDGESLGLPVGVLGHCGEDFFARDERGLSRLRRSVLVSTDACCAQGMNAGTDQDLVRGWIWILDP